MKKFLLCVAMLLIGAAAATAVLLFGFGYFPTSVSADSAAEPAENTAEAPGELGLLPYEVLNCIAGSDYASLSEYVHPEQGVVFSPYSTVSLASNQCFTASDVAKFSKNDSKYIWGVYDGVGDPIELTVSEYFDEFVFDQDYTHASAIGINYIIRSGNSLENVTEVFPDAQFADFYVAPSAEGTDDFDWHILRLVFDKYGDDYKLVAIINSRYTV